MTFFPAERITHAKRAFNMFGCITLKNLEIFQDLDFALDGAKRMISGLQDMNEVGLMLGINSF